MIKYKIRLFILSIFIGSMTVVAQNKIAEQKTKQTEAKMTDDELFSLITSLVGYVPTLGIPKDNRIPNDILMSAGYTPGIPRLGIPNIQSTDPIMASHSNAKHFSSHRRTLTDDQIKAIAQTGGIIGMNGYKEFVDDKNPEETKNRKINNG